MSDSTDTGPVLAADGSPLKQSLARALRREKMRALALIAPLLLFVVLTFIIPILSMLFRSVENQIVSDTMPGTVAAIQDWEAGTAKRPTNWSFSIFSSTSSTRPRPRSTPSSAPV